jgi:hypothetical protein
MRVEPVSPEAEENEQADLEMQDEPYEGDTETDQEDEALNDSVVRRPEAASLRTGITAGREGKLTLGALTFAVVDGALIETAASDQTAEARCAHDGQPNPRTAAPSTAAPSAHAPFNEAPMDISSIYGSLFSPTAELDVQSKDLLDENWFSDDEPLVNIRTGSLWEDTFAQSNYYAEPEADGIYLPYLSADSDFPMDGFGSESATGNVYFPGSWYGFEGNGLKTNAACVEDVDTATSTRKHKRSTPTMDTKRKHAKHRQTLSPRPREKRNRESAAEKQGQLASL